jgi:putative ATP-binding cassette transporter
VTLETPKGGRTLFSGLNVDLDADDNLVIVGNSGIGKSSLLRAVAGLWTKGQGQVERPPLEDIFFLPQKPYMLLGTLRQQLLYPKLDRNIDDSALQAALADVRLSELAGTGGRVRCGAGLGRRPVAG